ncbi:hypothetical protein H312_01539 [Anncaliia algerae PRA339]|uniref:Uncharacterized protein n=1 Tax=Anncaliia algerae PRA339 TaxID=1288291 RepID=A0A059F1C9_9MICR|nr:hypothetical protein H312_01539 [Anncaliia algerae PRA339]
MFRIESESLLMMGICKIFLLCDLLQRQRPKLLLLDDLDCIYFYQTLIHRFLRSYQNRLKNLYYCNNFGLAFFQCLLKALIHFFFDAFTIFVICLFVKPMLQ